MWAEFREWIVPLIAIGGIVWQAIEKLRRNVVRPEDLKVYATNGDLMASNKVLQDGIDENERTISTVDHRVAMVMKDVENLPTHATVQELRRDIGELKEGQVKTATALEGIDRTVSRIDDFLRNTK